MRRAALAFALLGFGCSDRPSGRVSFEKTSPATAEGRRVVEQLTRTDLWTEGFRAVDEKIGPFPAGLTVRVSFDGEGEEFGQGSATGNEGLVRFNLPKLEEYQRKVDELERQKKTLEAEGKKPVFRVPPARLDRMIRHELTHVLQAGVDAPDWFREGMAVWVSDDPNTLLAFASAGKKVESIEMILPARTDAYARGHLFWKWLDTKGAARKAARAAVLDRVPWKRAIEESTGLAWETIVIEERPWSAGAMTK